MRSGGRSRSRRLSPIIITLAVLSSLCLLVRCSELLGAVIDPERTGTDSGLSVASALITQAAKEGACVDDKGKPVIRPYTPVTAPDQKDRLDLLIKMCACCHWLRQVQGAERTRSYDQGKMSQHIGSLKPGEELKIKGPIPKCALPLELEPVRAPDTTHSPVQTERVRACALLESQRKGSPMRTCTDWHDLGRLWHHANVVRRLSLCSSPPSMHIPAQASDAAHRRQPGRQDQGHPRLLQRC